MIFWDTAMYIGIGKYIFSGGQLGFLEIFRPPLLPIILGLFWKIGFNPLLIGQILAIFFTLAEIYVIYLIGKEFDKKVGILAALLLLLTPVFIGFSTVPLTDIPAVFFATLTFWFVYKEKYILGGLTLALGFCLRFPEALILAPLVIYIACFYNIKSHETLKKISILFSAFFLPILPYFIINFILYHNPLLPILLAQQVASDPVNAHGINIFFYPLHLLLENPFYIFALLIPIAFFRNSEKKLAVEISLCFLIIGSYFNFNTHLEIRYSIAFLPFLALMSAWGIFFILEKITWKYRFETTVILIAGVLLSISYVLFVYVNPITHLTPSMQTYLSYFKDIKNSSIITTSPEMMAYSDIKIIDVTDSWENTLATYSEEGLRVDYITLNTCSITCEKSSTCTATQAQVSKYLTSHFTQTLSLESQGCKLFIYKKK